MANILVTGSNGQLGNEIRVLAQAFPNIRFTCTDVNELDITDIQAVESFLATQSFDYIINCAAYTNVNKAEDEESIAHKINALAPQILAQTSFKYGIKLIHISTDYVFDGAEYQPYSETHTVNPQSAYGRTKLAGEEMALQANPNTMVIRTAWLYSSFGNNFVKTMIKLGSERPEISVVFDQIGTPTYAADLANAILTIISKVEQKQVEFIAGVFHFSNEGVCSWYDFAKEIHSLTGVKCSVKPIETKDFPSPAKRPFYSVLNKQKIKSTYNISIPYWKESLAVCIQKIKQL